MLRGIGDIDTCSDAAGVFVVDVDSFLSCRACLKRDMPVRFLCSGKPVDMDLAVGAVGGRGAAMGRSWTSLTKSRPGKGVGEDVDAFDGFVEDVCWDSSSPSGT